MALSKLTVEVRDRGGARAVSERLSGFVPEPLALTEFENAATAGWRVEAYFEDAPELALVVAELSEVATPTGLSIEAVPDENWVSISQAALPPVVAGRFIVHGSHDTARVGHRLWAIEIDAGEAFGTAHHATTLGCLLALDGLARSRPAKLRRVLDLGCGSGVLAIAAARVLPAAKILASDIDPAAVAVARANVARNRARGRVEVICATGLAHPVLRRAQPFDLVLANILAGPLIAMAPDLARAIRRGGIAVLSGILIEQVYEVEAAWTHVGFCLRQKRLLNGWAVLCLERH
jgi:ribosomal protein L11 methyltransferase